ncbi:hypothetical protein EON65_11845 [archaeon]|nr:MAG: hypothetical protein EON65_11845 [archaeon]
MRSTRNRSRKDLPGEEENDAVIEIKDTRPSRDTPAKAVNAETRKSPRHTVPSPNDDKISPSTKQEKNDTVIKSIPKFQNDQMDVEVESESTSLPSKARRGRKSNAQKALERETQTLKVSQSSNSQGNSLLASHATGEGLVHPSVIDVDGDPQHDIHPLKVGHHLIVRYRDGSDRLARIVEVSPQQQYYIHYLDFNRRMDEWVAADRILHLPSIANRRALDYCTSSPVDPMSNPRIDASSTHILSTVADLDHDEHEGLDEESLLEHEKVTKVKNIRTVQLGKYIMECWYFSPFPREYYPTGFTDCLYFCEFSMRFFRTKQELVRYQTKPGLNRYPPGNEIYRDENVSFFELDGAVEKIYCQNLCYFAKLFLDHKTLYWDVDQFLFYVLCVQDDRGYHPVGYFSKEK